MNVDATESMVRRNYRLHVYHRLPALHWRQQVPDVGGTNLESAICVILILHENSEDLQVGALCGGASIGSTLSEALSTPHDD